MQGSESRQPAAAAESVRCVGVTGASGQVGYFLLPRLLAQGFQVHALGRAARPARVAAHPNLRWIEGALEAGWPRDSAIDALLSAGPLDGLSGMLARGWPHGLMRVVALSSTSIDSKRNSPDAAERALAQRLAEAESSLRASSRAAGAKLTRIRPTLIYGCGRDRSLTPLVVRARRLGWIPMPWPARGMRQPVHADDLARLMLLCLLRDDLDGLAIEAGGGERLPFSQMLRRAVAAGAGVHRTLPVPRALLALLKPRMRGALVRLSQDLVADNNLASERLGWHPRPFAPGALDFEIRTDPYVIRDVG